MHTTDGTPHNRFQQEVETSLTLAPEQAAKTEHIKEAVAILLQLPLAHITALRILRKSVDARSRQPKIVLYVKAYINCPAPTANYEPPHYESVADAQPVIVVGAGPAGLFGALHLIENGLRPIVLERGKEVSERKRDIALLNRNEAFNEESNYCFGEGGAGTFSDGKLYSRSKKRGDIHRIFELFHYHGASDNILYEAHPHIGSDKLPSIIRHMRETIIACGGEIQFNTRMTSLLITDGTIKGCTVSDGRAFHADKLLLAIGHSAHDTYEALHRQGVTLEAKGFAMGVRVEHPQGLIDSIQYHSTRRNPFLPAASYALVAQSEGRGVYSFCMCPGGHIVPAGSDTQGLVVNGMSASHRNSPYANSGIVVEIRPEDIPAPFSQEGALAGLHYQKYVEQLCREHNNGQGMSAPAQRLDDFVAGRPSCNLPPSSYLPGLICSPLHEWLPSMIGRRLQDGFRQFDRKMRGYLTHEAIVVGIESRSSSPVRIPRNTENYEHVGIKGLYPCGEGAGYAGGITSSAMDGINAAQKIIESLTTNH